MNGTNEPRRPCNWEVCACAPGRDRWGRRAIGRRRGLAMRSPGLQSLQTAPVHINTNDLLCYHALWWLKQMHTTKPHGDPLRTLRPRFPKHFFLSESFFHRFLFRTTRFNALFWPHNFVFIFIRFSFYYFFNKPILCPTRNLNWTNFLSLLKRKWFSTFVERVAFGIVLLLKRHRDCNFRDKTNGKMWSHHLLLILWKTNPTWSWGEGVALNPGLKSSRAGLLLWCCTYRPDPCLQSSDVTVMDEHSYSKTPSRSLSTHSSFDYTVFRFSNKQTFQRRVRF